MSSKQKQSTATITDGFYQQPKTKITTVWLDRISDLSDHQKNWELISTMQVRLYIRPQKLINWVPEVKSNLKFPVTAAEIYILFFNQFLHRTW